MVKLYTERLIIRDHVIEDLMSYHDLLSDQVSMKYLQGIKTKSLKESEENLIKAIAETKLKNRKLYFFRMENKITQEYIGEIGYTVKKNTPFGKIVDLGYFTKEQYWHQGYTTEALEGVLKYAFEENHVYKITTGCLKENIGSEKVMKKCGMIKESEFKAHTLHEGQLKDRVAYGLLKKEWRKV